MGHCQQRSISCSVSRHRGQVCQTTRELNVGMIAAMGDIRSRICKPYGPPLFSFYLLSIWGVTGFFGSNASCNRYILEAIVKKGIRISGLAKTTGGIESTKSIDKYTNGRLFAKPVILNLVFIGHKDSLSAVTGSGRMLSTGLTLFLER